MNWPAWLDRGRRERELDEELEAHFALEMQQRIDAGETREEAEFAARRAFGNIGRVKEVTRTTWTWNWLNSSLNNLSLAFRTLRRAPGFTTVAVLSLALGIGANASVFTLLDQLVLRLLPVKDPERLVMIWTTGPHFGSNNGPRSFSYPMYQDFSRRAEVFDSVFCQFDTHLAITAGGGAERVDAELVSGNYFQSLGIGAAAGRVFSPQTDDRTYKGHPVVVLSYRYWLNRFAGDRGAIGRKILLNDYPMEIVGVAAAGFGGLDPSQSPHLWVPIQMKPLMTPGTDDLGNRRSQWVEVFARLKPGHTVTSAQASVQPLLHQILQQEAGESALLRISQYDRDRFLKRKVFVQTAAGGYSYLRQQYSTALMVLMGMAALILLIACSNVANLMIARAAVRRKEIAVRLSLGAPRRTLIGLLLAESLLLSLAGAGFGLLLSRATTHALLNMLPDSGAMLMLSPNPDFRILLFTICIAVITGFAFGLTPSLEATKLDLITTLKGAANAVAGGGSSPRLRQTLVTAQVALSFLLIAAAGLFTKTLSNLKSVEPGFRRIDTLATFQIDPVRNGYTVPRIRQFYTEILNQLRTSPGVKSAAYAMWPLLSRREWDLTVAVEGHQGKDGEDMQAYYNLISPGYWRAMGVPLLQGRDFDERDLLDSTDPQQLPTVAIVNREFAEHFFGKQNPVGRHIGCCRGPNTKTDIQIVGVAGDALFGGPRAGIPRQVLFFYPQAPYPHSVSFYVRTDGEPAAIFQAIRATVARLDSSIPIYEMKTLESQLNETLGTERLIASLSAVFGALATLMAALGLYGVMSFIVARRTKEIGLRMALGARQRSVLWLVLREVLVLLGVGLLIGVPSAYLLNRYISAQLFGIAPTDAETCVAAIAILAIVAAVSGFVPARRASTIDPITALRYE